MMMVMMMVMMMLMMMVMMMIIMKITAGDLQGHWGSLIAQDRVSHIEYVLVPATAFNTEKRW